LDSGTVATRPVQRVQLLQGGAGDRQQWLGR
jgi:hypothetical protein